VPRRSECERFACSTAAPARDAEPPQLVAAEEAGEEAPMVAAGLGFEHEHSGQGA
jgi:hypothetical protein